MVIEDNTSGNFADPNTVWNRLAGMLLLVYCAPLLLGIAIVVRFDTGGSPILNGRNGGGSLWRFRTTREGETLETSFGSFLRRTRLELLPQFANVARGEITVSAAFR